MNSREKATLSPAQLVEVRRNRRRGRLRLLGVAALIWVSYGSFAIIMWSYNIQWGSAALILAVAYPIIVDAGVVFVMPYSSDASLPETTRKYASTTVRTTFVAVMLFNALHAVIEAGVHLPSWARPAVAVVSGLVPVWLYLRAQQLATGVETHEMNQRADDEKVRAEQAAADRAATERADTDRRIAAEAEERAARLRREELAAQAELSRARAAEAAAAAPVLAEAPREVHRPGGGKRTPEQEAYLAGLAGRNLAEKAASYLRERWDAGEDITPTEAARALGVDPSDVRKAAKAIRADGVLPPSERPRLALAGKQ